MLQSKLTRLDELEATVLSTCDDDTVDKEITDSNSYQLNPKNAFHI